MTLSGHRLGLEGEWSVIPLMSQALKEMRQASGLEGWDKIDRIGVNTTEDLTWDSLMESQHLNTGHYIACAKHARTREQCHQTIMTDVHVQGTAPLMGSSHHQRQNKHTDQHDYRHQK